MIVEQFTFKGISSKDFGIKILNIERNLFPEVKHNLIDIPGRRGKLLSPQKPKSREMKIDCFIQGETYQDLSEKLIAISAWLYSEKWEKLEIYTMEGKHFMAIVNNKIIFEQNLLNVNFTIHFEMQPDIYGEKEEIYFVNDKIDIYNIGNIDSEPSFWITFLDDTTFFEIKNGEEFIKINYSFLEGDTLSISSGKIILNNTINILHSLDWKYSKFFTLKPKESSLEIFPKNICLAKIEFTPRWI